MKRQLLYGPRIVMTTKCQFRVAYGALRAISRELPGNGATLMVWRVNRYLRQEAERWDPAINRAVFRTVELDSPLDISRWLR